MYHDYPRLFKGNFPYAVRHAAVTDGFDFGVRLAKELSKEPLSDKEAEAYVAACLATKGQPQILDLIEGSE
jgi:hypothetical protein